MELTELGALTLESAGSLLIMCCVYKLYRAKIDTESDGSCCKIFNFKVATHNQGNQSPQKDMLSGVV
jgi:hypothetical protein